MKTHRARGGHTLIEVLLCIALAAALFPSVSKFFISITRLHEARSAALDRVLAFDGLERDLRAAVAQAVSVEASFGPYKTEGRTVVLRMLDGYAVFTVDPSRQPSQITFTPQADGRWAQRIFPYSVPRWQCRFEAKPGGRTLDFYARPAPPAGSQRGARPAVVHMLAALRGAGGL